MSKSPQKYRVRISNKGTNDNQGYFSATNGWSSTTKEDADVLSYKEARRIAAKMKRLGYYASVECLWAPAQL